MKAAFVLAIKGTSRGTPRLFTHDKKMGSPSLQRAGPKDAPNASAAARTALSSRMFEPPSPALDRYHLVSPPITRVRAQRMAGPKTIQLHLSSITPAIMKHFTEALGPLATYTLYMRTTAVQWVSDALDPSRPDRCPSVQDGWRPTKAWGPMEAATRSFGPIAVPKKPPFAQNLRLCTTRDPALSETIQTWNDMTPHLRIDCEFAFLNSRPARHFQSDLFYDYAPMLTPTPSGRHWIAREATRLLYGGANTTCRRSRTNQPLPSMKFQR